MASEFECRPEILQGIAQSLLEMKKMARSIEQSADALLPMASQETIKTLCDVIDSSRNAASMISRLYYKIAKEAMA